MGTELAADPTATPKAPSLSRFTKEMRKQYGNLSQNQVDDLYERNIWRRLMNASGEVLNQLSKSVGLEREIGNVPIADPKPRQLQSEIFARQAEALKGTEMFQGQQREARQLSKEARARETEIYNRRSKAISRIAGRLLEQIEARESLSRKTVDADQVDFSTPET